MTDRSSAAATMSVDRGDRDSNGTVSGDGELPHRSPGPTLALPNRIHRLRVWLAGLELPTVRRDGRTMRRSLPDHRE